MRKYHLKGLDCPNCAAEIEENLRKRDDVRDVSLNFATSTLYLDADNIQAIYGEIKKVEPNVKIVELSSREHENDSEDDFNIKMELILIASAATLFLLGMILKDRLHNTPYAVGEYLIFLPAYLLSGRGVLSSAGRNILRGRVFDENFLMTVATLGAICIHELPEAVGVMLFFMVGEFFQDLSINRSRRSIKSLLAIRPDYANLKRDSGTEKVSPEVVNVGETIIVKPGEKIPLDGEVIEGNSQVDTSALTGEPVPQMVKVGGTILAGMINKTGTLTVQVTKPFGESSISKILELVENASSKKAETEKFITKFARYYAPVVVFGALAVALLPPLLIAGASFSEWIYRALVLLVISCPCALVISIPLGYFGGVGGASRRGILIKGSNFLDVLTAVKTVVFDKTGTLTKGVFKVMEIVPKNGFTQKGLLSLAAEVESQSNHPIAQSIREAYGGTIDSSKIEDYKEITGYGIRAKVQNRVVIAGNDSLLHRENIAHDVCDVDGTVVHLAVDTLYAGYIVIADELREDALPTIQALKRLGVEKIIMLTGDSPAVAESVARSLSLDAYFGGLLPEEKVDVIEKLISEAGKGDKIAFVGDGINDAPVISRADVGIAMGGVGSDAAIDTADVVIMTDALSKVGEAIEIGRKTRKIVWQNIGFALGFKGIFIMLGIVGIATMWGAVFADMGVALISIFNATRALK
ncbi:cadmium-translocating P-type ATPase [Candidatus Poribacteria bacterium]|nr:cadmium-translocating P-type ATPase [Candidatus Poribacteria bacterium]